MSKQNDYDQPTVMIENTPTFTHKSFEVAYAEYQRLIKTTKKKFIWISFDDRVWDKVKDKE